MTQQSKVTIFVSKTVDKDEKQTMVLKVFHSVASKYDLMNDLMSLASIVSGNAIPLRQVV